MLLPAGHLTLLVTVEDRFGASASATAGATVLRLPVISTAVVDSVLSHAADKLQSGDPQAATQAGAVLLASANARETAEAEGGGSGGGGSLDATQAAQMREAVLEIVSSAAASTAPSAAAHGQTAAAVAAVVEVVGQVSEVVAQQATQLVGAMVNASLGIAEPLAEGTSTTVVHRATYQIHRGAASSTSNCRHERRGGARDLVDTLGGRAALPRHRFCHHHRHHHRHHHHYSHQHRHCRQCHEQRQQLVLRVQCQQLVLRVQCCSCTPAAVQHHCRVAY